MASSHCRGQLRPRLSVPPLFPKPHRETRRARRVWELRPYGSTTSGSMEPVRRARTERSLAGRDAKQKLGFSIDIILWDLQKPLLHPGLIPREEAAATWLFW